MRSVSSSASRARIQFSLPITVLISPLWATNRYGWASGHDGNVLVENRLCTRASADSTRSSVRSVKKAAHLVRDEHPLVHERARREAREVHRSPRRASPARARRACGRRSSGGRGRCRRAAACPSAAVRNTWRNDGSASAACCPIIELSTGTSRQPEHLQPLAGRDLLDPGHGRRLGSGSLRQEGDAGGVRAGGREVEVDDGPQEAVGHLDEDAGAVADVGLGVGGPAVVEVAQRGEAELDHPVRAAPVQVGDEGHAAGVVLEARVVEALLGGQHQQLSIPWSGGSSEQVQSSAVGRRWPAAGRTTLPIPRAEAANRYDHRAAGEGGRASGQWWLKAEMADVSEAYGAARELLDSRPRRMPRGIRGRRRPLPPASGSRRPSCSWPRPAAARRGRAEGRASIQARPLPRPRRPSTSTIRPARRPAERGRESASSPRRRRRADRPRRRHRRSTHAQVGHRPRPFDGLLPPRPPEVLPVWPVSPAHVTTLGRPQPDVPWGEVAWLVP